MSAPGKPLLTIAIPTYERAAALRRRFEELAEVVTPAVEVVVIDNGSTDETAAVGQAAAARYPWLRFESNVVNLGNDANGLRLFERARGEWTWGLGDDEPVAWRHLPALLALLETETADIIRLPGPGVTLPAGIRKSFDGLEDLITGFFSIGNLQEGSGGLLRTAKARPHLRAAYRFAGRLHSATPIMFGMAATGSRLVIHELPLLEERIQKKPRWPVLEAHLGAWETMRECVPRHLRKFVDEDQCRHRWRPLVKMVRAGVKGDGPPIDDLQLRRVLSVLPLRKWRHLAGVFWHLAVKGWPGDRRDDTGY